MKAILRKIRISPKKANLIAGIVRTKKVTDALDLLKFMPKKGAKILYKVVQSAASNAKSNFKQSVDDLIITKILVTKGPTYKRSLPISRGRTHPIRKRTSHITVEVGLPESEKVTKQSDKPKNTAEVSNDAVGTRHALSKDEQKPKKPTDKKSVTKKETKKSDKSDKQ